MATPNIIHKELLFASCKIDSLLSILNQYGESRIIGGAVRDSIIGLPNQDIDIATTIHPQQVIEILQNANIKAIPTGVAYGTVTCILGKEVFEITTLRRDITCLGRKAIVEFSNNFKEDALRRDFTINALSYDYFSQEIYDYTGGYNDILDREVKFIGNAYNRINEDYLRILRFFRFTSKYADKIDLQGLEASKDLMPKIQDIAKERIHKEIMLLFETKNVASIISVMQEKEILKHIFLKIDFDAKMLQNASQSNIGPVGLMGLSITNLDSNFIKTELRYLKFPNKVIHGIIKILHLKLIIQQESLDFAIKMSKLEGWYNKNMMTIAALYTNIALDTAEDLIKFYHRLNVPALPVNGGDFVKSGIRHKTIGAAIKQAKFLWIKSNFHITKEHLIQRPHSTINL